LSGTALFFNSNLQQDSQVVPTASSAGPNANNPNNPNNPINSY